MVHLKIKFYSLKHKVVTLDADLEFDKCCHFLSLKSQRDNDCLRESNKNKQQRKRIGKGFNVNLADLDARYDTNNSKEEGDGELTKELKKRIKSRARGRVCLDPTWERPSEDGENWG